MANDKKTKSQLIDELDQLRARVAELENVENERIRTEGKLLFLSFITEQVSDAIIATDLDYRIIYTNRSCQELYGYSQDELHGQSPAMLSAEPDVDNVQNDIYTTVSSGQVWRGEAFNRRKDGSTFLCEIAVFPLANESGVIFAYASVQRDITARKDTENALLRRQAELEAFFSNAAVGIAVTDPEGHFIRVNRHYLDMFGYSSEQELFQNTVRDVTYPDDRSGTREAQRKLASGELSFFRAEKRYLRKDGTVFWGDVSVSPVQLRGDIDAFIAIIIDITARRQVEDALRDNEERFRNMANSLPQVVFEADPSGTLTFVNDYAFEMFGYTRQDFDNGLNAVDILVPEDRERGAQTIKNVLSGTYTRGNEYGALKKDGTRVPISIYSAPIIHDGKPVGFRGIIVDITERKHAEQKRLELERQIQHVQRLKSLGIMAGGIAHDFNNLLMAILGNADLALHDLPLDVPSRKNIQEVVTASKRAAGLVNQMMAYSGGGRFVVQPVNINEVVEEMTHLLEASVSNKVTVKYTMAANLPLIDADPSQIRQVVMNLIVNASDAIGNKAGLISVWTGVTQCDSAYLNRIRVDEVIQPGDYVYIEVSDTGCGMDETVMAKMFDPFFTTKFSGRGLGMAAVLGIVNRHRGAIDIQSEPGKGSTFKVLFPVRKHKRKSELTTNVGHTTVEPLDTPISGTVLLVDDEATVLSVAQRMLEEIGLNVLTAVNGLDAIDTFKKHHDKISCVILDLTMPRLDGEEAFVELEQMGIDVPVVISSGHSEQNIAKRFADKNIAGIIHKPFQAHELAAKLREVLN